jgi:hypothetical protein
MYRFLRGLIDNIPCQGVPAETVSLQPPSAEPVQALPHDSRTTSALPTVNRTCRNQAMDGSLTPNGNGNLPSLDLVEQAWPQLPPHVRETIVTLVDAALVQRRGESPP